MEKKHLLLLLIFLIEIVFSNNGVASELEEGSEVEQETEEQNSIITNATKYLTNYGFLNVSSSENTDLKSSIIRLQEFFNLETTGKLDNETLEFMKRPRCGVADFPPSFSAYRKWNKTTLRWHFKLGTPDQREQVSRAFQAWSGISNLNFLESPYHPDIVLSMSDGYYSHYFSPNCDGNGSCPFKFDGIGGTLAHSYFPSPTFSCREIHFDKFEAWVYDDRNISSTYTRFYSVALHEIGHVLGLSHSSQADAVMFPLYSDSKNLSSDDINGIHALYGVRTTKRPIASTTTTTRKPSTTATTTTTTKKKIETLNIPDLCQITPDHFLITLNAHLYITYQDYIWIIKLDELKYGQPQRISNYIKNIPNISHMYQRSEREIFVLSNETFYLINFPELTIKPGWEGHSTSIFGLSNENKINAIFKTYSGRNYIFYDGRYYKEFNDCNLTSIKHGLIVV